MSEQLIMEVSLVFGFLGYFILLISAVWFWSWIRQYVSGIGLIGVQALIGFSFWVAVLFLFSIIRLILDLEPMGPIVKWTMTAGFVTTPWWVIIQGIRWIRRGGKGG